MRQPQRQILAWLMLAACASTICVAETPLHERIDALIDAGHQQADVRPAGVADDAEFLRRIHLDFAGVIPTADEARALLDNADPDKRAKLIDALLADARYAPHMAQVFHIMLMERRGDDEQWLEYLRRSFAANKPWNTMARQLLNPDARDEATRASAFFYAKRLEHYGQNPIDYPGLTRDVGRLFMGVDLQCAQCHDHIFVDQYKQRDFQGLFIAYQNLSLLNGAGFPAVSEKPIEQKAEFVSVFGEKRGQTGPRVPFGREFEIPALDNKELYAIEPDKKSKLPGVPKFSALAAFAETIPAADNPYFARNIANRLWFIMMGRGLVEPLDQHHDDNPPTNPELLELLAKEFAAHDFDIKWLLRELALTRTYQRSGLMPQGVERSDGKHFAVAIERRLSAEQIMASMLAATGEASRFVSAGDEKEDGDAAKKLKALRDAFVEAMANPPGEPEERFAPSLAAALFMRNSDTVQELLRPRDGNLVDRLAKMEDAGAIADELYLAVLTRRPSDDERAFVAALLEKHKDARAAAIARLAWAMLASTEFVVNH